MRAHIRVFKDPNRLAEMLALRLSGWGKRPLTILYNVDRTTIEWWCSKYGIVPIRKIIVHRTILLEMKSDSIPITDTPTKVYKYSNLLDEVERVNDGSDYKHQLVRSRKRELIRLGILKPTYDTRWSKANSMG